MGCKCIPPDYRWKKIGKNAYILPRNKMTKQEKIEIFRVKRFKTKKIITSIITAANTGIIQKYSTCNSCCGLTSSTSRILSSTKLAIIFAFSLSFSYGTSISISSSSMEVKIDGC